MVKVRFSHLDDFVLKDDGKVGIGTSLPSARVEVIGTVRAANIKSSSGITTVTSIDGYMNQDMEYSDGVNINTGDSGTLSGEIVVGSGLTMTVGTGATTGQGTIESMKVSNTFNPPIGRTNDRPSAPKPGALFYNKDFRTIEYWDGSFWRQVDNVTTSGRGIFGGGQPAIGAGYEDPIQYIQIQSKGNAQYFGELASTGHGSANCACASSAIRGLFGGGSNPNNNYMNVIEYVTIASGGNGINFGDLTERVSYLASCSSSTRGVWMGGYVGTPHPAAHDTNVIHYVEMSTLGDAQDFGDLNVKSYSPCAGSNGVRAIKAGGTTTGGAQRSEIESFTITSKGDAKNFGDLTERRFGPSGSSNRTRMVVAGGRNTEIATKSIEFITMASEGNGVDFGTMSVSKERTCSVADQTRCVFATGDKHPASGATNVIEFIQIASGGNTEDFGDMTNADQYAMGSCSDSHGGLGGY
tara:strand:+ start:198 stop:1601 length:1404 start_codon:yes stop_codon:yes gene_type:complete